ncbi:MAG TPA: TolC family protein, partial [Spirochaetia bacterium]|nr:TolC family protein [Spirochaetia bacterium]
MTLLSCAVVVSGQPAAPAPRVVGLEECITLGFAHDAGLRTDELEARIADARVQEMQRQYAPSLSLQAGYSRLSDVAPGTFTASTGGPSSITVTFPPSLLSNTSIRLALQQPVFTGRRIESSIRQAEAARDSSRGDLGRSRLDLRYSVTEAYWSLARARAQVAAIQQSVAPAESHLADALKLLGQGMATNNDVLQARMRLQDIRIDLASAQTMRDISRARLALLVGLPWGDGLEIP